MNANPLLRLVAALTAPDRMAAGLAPALIIVWIVVVTSGDRARWHSTLAALGWGVVSVLPVLVVDLGIERAIPATAVKWLTSFQAAARAGVVEELVRAATIAILLRRREADRIAPAVVVGAAVGAGFAAIENVADLAMSQYWTLDAVARIMSVACHISAGIILAAAIAGTRTGDAPARPARWLAAALLLLIAAHTSFDMLDYGKDWAWDAKAVEEGRILVPFLFLAGQTVLWLALGIWTGLTVRNFNRRTPVHRLIGQSASTFWRSVWAVALGGIGLSFTSVGLMLRFDATHICIGAFLLLASLAIVWRCRAYVLAHDAAPRTTEAVFDESPPPMVIADNGRSYRIILKAIRVLIPILVSLFALRLYLELTGAFEAGVPPEILRFRMKADEDSLSATSALLCVAAYVVALIGMVPTWMDIRWGRYLVTFGLVAGGLLMSGSSRVVIQPRSEILLAEVFSLCAYILAALCFVRIAQTRPVASHQT